MADVKGLLREMKAFEIPREESGPWIVTKRLDDQAGPFSFPGRAIEHTGLIKVTMASAQFGGEVVMEDSDVELLRHVEFVLRARGRVLVTGLGLGCVVRGLLTRPVVESIDVIEKDERVADMVWPYMPKDDRLNLILCDATTYKPNGQRWDFAWHDLFTDKADGELALSVVHVELIARFRHRVDCQWAWGMPRWVKRFAQLTNTW